MNVKEEWSRILSEGEDLKWVGSPKEVKLLDTASKGKTLILWLIAAAWIAASLIVVLPIVISTDDSIAHMAVVMVILDCIPILMFSMPFVDKKELDSQTQYAITDRRILIRIKDRTMTMVLKPDTAVEARKRKDNTGNVLLGEAVKKRDSALRTIAGRGLDKNGKTVGLVLYHIEDPQTVVSILKKSCASLAN